MTTKRVADLHDDYDDNVLPVEKLIVAIVIVIAIIFIAIMMFDSGSYAIFTNAM